LNSYTNEWIVGSLRCHSKLRNNTSLQISTYAVWHASLTYCFPNTITYIKNSRHRGVIFKLLNCVFILFHNICKWGLRSNQFFLRKGSTDNITYRIPEKTDKGAENSKFIKKDTAWDFGLFTQVRHNICHRSIHWKYHPEKEKKNTFIFHFM